jgi:hypothetical protein
MSTARNTPLPALFTGAVTRLEYNSYGSTVRKTRYYLMSIPLLTITTVDIRARTYTKDEAVKRLLESAT